MSDPAPLLAAPATFLADPFHSRHRDNAERKRERVTGAIGPA
ncbi:MAG: hypothetical protein Q7S40_23630 [Opitutaceae bacterium]|nr:hypothetical protein [Opitutaceae bacterium]